MLILEPKTKSDFKQYYDFRWRMLRKPWQQPRGSEKDELEDQSFHVMAVDDNDSVIAAGRVHFLDESTAQIRYMAVDDNQQNQGYGTLILKALEQYAINHNRQSILLHARENALGFYQKQGYQLVNKSHILYGCIQHYEMRKNCLL